MENQIENFPPEVIEKMLERQVEQGNKRDVTVFEKYSLQDRDLGGMDWCETVEGIDFWRKVIDKKRFDVFFSKYPKQTYPKVMLVSDVNDITTARKRVVFMQKNGIYLAWQDRETIEEAEKELDVKGWNYAWDIPIEQPVKEVTMDEVAKAFGVDKIKIVKQ